MERFAIAYKDPSVVINQFPKNVKIALTSALISLPLAPVMAQDGGAVLYKSSSVAKDIPSQLKRSQSEHYRAIFKAMGGNQWDMAKNLIADAPTGPLKSIAQAEYFLAANSPRAELGPLLILVNEAPHIPQAAQLGRLAKKRGAQLLPNLPQRRNLSYVPGLPIRKKPRAIKTNNAANAIRGRILNFIKSDSPQSGEALLFEAENILSSEVRTELEQRIAWSYYIENDDKSAQRMAQKAQKGSGPWVVHADWVAGLSSWRLNDCRTASAAFDNVGRRAANADLQAAGLYWGARSDIVCGQPQKAQGKLQMAAKRSDSFYGLLSAQTLGMNIASAKSSAGFAKGDWKTLKQHDNVKAAIALVEIGEESLADEVLRHQARIGNSSDHAALLKLSRELNLPRTQLWLAHHAPRGFKPDSQARFPAPKWKPDGGWRVDPALVYAHTLQESAFRSKAVSPANAIGLMQVRPGTAGDIARANGRKFEKTQLFKPSTNLEYGQSYLEYLGRSSITGGKLPKVAAAYNAGPGSVQRWNNEIKDNGDPLLYMESIPYVETRGYVSIILRNYWMYEQQAGIKSASLGTLAQNKWPVFPNKPSKSKTRFTGQ
ncbi:lytic transglycosylase domain-containing protein [Parasphingorhabdus cellanae]|uniref:Lytic transglycosylase domain-containing protein n=1 Tax=Parasphingorhabdus cellanae TaxID=2806553 RepID=A0ABX7T5X0_9SPHN|nr:lytic transglycosylase domain-containing protein [Parasphingorhabdus cellanae]QTD56313.1 lytic transglycosylase domain-containing protein [Parasphingorhabdus cellanae]